MANDTRLLINDPLSNETMYPSIPSLDEELYTSRLLFCCARGDLKLLESLHKQFQPDLNIADYDGRSCLHVAAGLGHVAIVRYLLKHGAYVNVRDRFGGSPHDDAIRHGQDEITEILVEYGASQPAEAFDLELIQACSQGKEDKVYRLLRNKVNPNCCDYDGRTPLHLAVSIKNVNIVKSLLDKGANPLLVDRFGSTPLSDAIRNKTRVGEDKVLQMLKAATASDNNEEKSKALFGGDSFFHMVLGFEIIVLILHGLFSGYGYAGMEGQRELAQDMARYPYFQDIHVMIFIGFGFLMTFLRKYGYSSLGLTFIIGAIVIQWHPLVNAFMEGVFNNGHFKNVEFNLSTIIVSDFAAGAVLISFGALLGKISPLQLVIMSLFEIIFYAINEHIGHALHITDVGGSMVIHTFGAFFGLACSRIITDRNAQGNLDNSAVYHSDMFAMIGTIFLWLFWPSFNAAMTGKQESFERAIVNTLLSLTGSCIVAFFSSFALRGEKKFCMVDIQNATLAGGVAIGASADLPVGVATSIAVGMVAGFVSVFGYTRIQSKLERHFGIYDTCGILNLHGMPGLIGGLAVFIASGSLSMSTFSSSIDESIASKIVDRTQGVQAAYQLCFLFVTFAFAIYSGTITGVIIKRISPSEKFFSDEQSWEVPEMEKPYYFDTRGEVEHRETNAIQLTRADIEKIFDEKMNYNNIAEI